MRSSILTRVLTAAALSNNADGYVPNAPIVPTRSHTALHAAFSPESESHIVGRRKVFHSILGGAAACAFVAMPKVASALDMDAFASSEVSFDEKKNRSRQLCIVVYSTSFVCLLPQLDSDTKNCNPKIDSKCIPKLTEDEALCKYGQSGEARGEACKRVKQRGGELPSTKQGKSLGGAYAM
jgi:hypothetical protein